MITIYVDLDFDLVMLERDEWGYLRVRSRSSWIAAFYQK